VVREGEAHRRYLAVYDRVVRFPGGREVAWDVVGHPPSFAYAAVLPFHSGGSGGEVTLVREWAQGPNRWVFGLPTGCFDRQRHASLEACARAELSEEARLKGGSWHSLLPPEHPGLAEVKWGLNRMHPFLVVDPEQDLDPGARDAEEALLETERVSVVRLQELVLGGEMLMPSVSAALHALHRLRQLGLLGAGGSAGLL